MRMRHALYGVTAVLVSTAASAGLECNTVRCDVKWRTSMGEIDLPTVCANYKGKPDYAECRALAAEVFERRCRRGKANNNPVWVDVYCTAAETYRP